MRFSVGYQLPEGDEEPFVSLVTDYREHIAEVYFPWAGLASGRASLTERRGYVDWAGQRRLEEDLIALRGMGLRLDVLFNANCYGPHAASQYLQHQVASVLEHLDEVIGGVDVVTTTSLAVALTVKRHFPSVEVRASVNMRIGTVQGMAYVSGLFDSYHVQRDYNRDLTHLGELRRWADEHGKTLYMLANSGCLAFCSGQSFHDNLVAHEREGDEVFPIPDWMPMVCWSLLQKRENRPVVLQSTWVRPEDLHHYEELFPVVKLATRMHANPRLVLDAYTRRRHPGNLLDLFEPGFGPAFAPTLLDNTRFPADWFERTSTCSRQCHRCGYCAEVLEQIAVEVEG